MNGNNNDSTVLSALGYGALPQSVVPVTKTQTQIQRTQYDPNKMKALMDALGAPKSVPGIGEAIANALTKMPESHTYTGGFGEQIINPWEVAISSLARGAGDVYSQRAAAVRDAEEAARENAIKAAQIELDADKQQITSQVAQDYLKVNDPNAKGAGGTPEQQAVQKESALAALKELDDLAKHGGITSMNKSTDNWWLAGSSSKNIGRREQALSALLPLTNAIARASGGSGINTLGEMLAYLGVPENATSKQLEGVLPGLVKKLGLESEFYQMSPVSQAQTINGFTIEKVE